MNWIKLIVINVMVMFVLAEITLRFIYTPRSLQNRIELNSLATAQAQGERAIFNYSEMRFQPFSKNTMNHTEYSISTVHDKLGFRNPCAFNDNWQNYNLIIGDSFVYGTGLPDEYTYGCLLSGKESSFYSMGIPGLDVSKSLKMLKANIDRVRSEMSEPSGVYFFLFLGNDFESLVKFGSTTDLNTKNVKHSNSALILSRINWIVTKVSFINQSYLITSLKLLLKPIIKPSDKGEYVITYAGSTLYKSTSVRPVSEISNAISKIKSELTSINLAVDGFFLIEDPAILDSKRLDRDLSVANYYATKTIDLEFKIASILDACKIQKVSCFDTREVLEGTSYYKHDNHLNISGAKRLSEYVSAIIENHM